VTRRDSLCLPVHRALQSLRIVDFNILRQLFQQFPSAKVRAAGHFVLREGGQIDPTGLPIHLRPSLHSRGQPCASRRSRRR
jgi:hypothetical protein